MRRALHRPCRRRSLTSLGPLHAHYNMPIASVISETEKLRDAFAGMVGGLLLNFGALEFISYRWAEILSTDKVVRDLAIDMPLAKRIGLIKRLIERSGWREDQKKEAESLWSEVLELAKARNTLAHNPLLTKPEPDGTVTFGVINAKEMKGTGPYSIAPVLPRDVHSAGCRAGTLIERLESFIKNQST